MKSFKIYIDKNIGKVEGFVRSRDTRNGFAHDCSIPRLNVKVSCHYLNRTWESFGFESVIGKALYMVTENTLGLKGKKFEKIRSKVYGKLRTRMTDMHKKGKLFKYIPQENCIFG